jgi:hypothetical protein
MEAATPLRQPHVTILANRLLVDGLAIDDACAVELVRRRAEAGEEPANVVADAVEIGARVLDREQTGATVELFRADLERSTREAETALRDRARDLAEEFTRKFDEAFGADNGHLARELQRLFGDESSAAVQHKVREVMGQAAQRMQADMVRQFSAEDGTNPLADFKAGMVRVQRQQVQEVVAMREQLVELRSEVQRLHAEREKAAEVAAEHDRSTAKGRPYEEAVFEAVDAIAGGFGDVCEPVGDVTGTGGRKGDVLAAIEGCSGPARGRIVVEAKNSQVSRNRALADLDEAMTQRDADYGIWVVPSEDKLPARTRPLREVNGDKLFVVYDPEDGSRLALEVAYSLARARVLMAKGNAEGLDTSALRSEVERALGALEDERRVKQQLTQAANGITEARKIVEAMGERVREHLRAIDAMVAPGGEDGVQTGLPLE